MAIHIIRTAELLVLGAIPVWGRRATLPPHDRNELRVGRSDNLAKTLQIFAPELLLITEEMNMPQIAYAMLCL
jgi:hypothetical protein